RPLDDGTPQRPAALDPRCFARRHRVGGVGPGHVDLRDLETADVLAAALGLAGILELADPALDVGVHPTALSGTEVVDGALPGLAALGGCGHHVGGEPHARGDLGDPAARDLPCDAGVG